MTTLSDRTAARRRRMVARARAASMATVDRLGTSTELGAPWVSGLAAGLQAAVLSALTVIVPTVAVFVATAADPTNAEVSWWASVRVGAGLWVLGHGGRVVTAAGVVSLVPLGIAALSYFLARATGRRSGRATPTAIGAGAAVFTAAVLIAGFAAAATDAVGLVRAGLGAAVVSAAGLTSGAMRRDDAPTWGELLAPVGRWVPGWARAGLFGAAGALAASILAAAVLAVVWTIQGAHTIGQIVIGLGVDPFSGAALAVAELAFLPNFLVWALAFLAGPGFAVGATTTFAPAAIISGPLPAVPLLGALPKPDSVGGAWTYVPWVIVVAGAVGGWVLHRRLRSTAWWHVFAAAGVGAVVVGLGAGILTMIASGGLAPGRMSQFGADPFVVGLRFALLAGAGLAVVAVVADSVLRATVRGSDAVEVAGDPHAVTELIEQVDSGDAEAEPVEAHPADDGTVDADPLDDGTVDARPSPDEPVDAECAHDELVEAELEEDELVDDEWDGSERA